MAENKTLYSQLLLFIDHKSIKDIFNKIEKKEETVIIAVATTFDEIEKGNLLTDDSIFMFFMKTALALVSFNIISNYPEEIKKNIANLIKLYKK